jgi:hypothetical protein
MIEWSRSTLRHQWWSAFVVFFVLAAAWSIATPLFASPDEPSHVVRAASLVRGQILGDEPRGRAAEGSLVVDLPAIFRSGERVKCLAFQPEATADCFGFTGSTNEVGVTTTAGRHPPWWYVPIGFPSYLASGVGVRLMRLVNAALAAALLASAFASTRRLPSPTWATTGFAVAVTPMVLFLSGVVNPSAVEIAAAICLWCTGVVLIREATTNVETRLVVRLAVAAVALALTRQLGPFWLALVAATLAAVGGVGVVKALWSSRAFRYAVGAAVAATVVQAAWLVSAGTLDSSNSNTPGVPGSLSNVANGSLGRGLVYYDELIGVFGWRDTSPPSAVFLLWTAAIAALATVGILLARRPVVMAMLSTALLTWLLPIVFETRDAHNAGYFWQGRYTLPLAVGVPILAAFGSAESGRIRRVASGRVVWCLGVALGVSQVLAFGQAIRRYAVGAHGPNNFFTDTAWSPPVPAALLLVGFAIAVAAWYALLLAEVATSDEPDEPDVPSAPFAATTG